MRVQCSFEGERSRATNWSLPPSEAAQRHADAYALDVETQHVVVTPLDDEARALSGWQTDDEDQWFKLFVVTSKTTWTSEEVATFNPSEGDSA